MVIYNNAFKGELFAMKNLKYSLLLLCSLLFVNSYGMEPIQQAQRIDPITEKQFMLLHDKGLTNQEISDLSKQEATRVITEILKMQSWKITTAQQRMMLRDMGLSNLQSLTLSSDEASKLINSNLKKNYTFNLNKYISIYQTFYDSIQDFRTKNQDFT